MLKPYPKDLNEQINRLSVMLDNSPAEAFLAIIHTINFLAQECNRLVSYDHELSWEAVRSAFSDQLFDVFSHEPPPVENGPAYQKTCAYLRRIFHTMRDLELGLPSPIQKSAASSPYIVPRSNRLEAPPSAPPPGGPLPPDDFDEDIPF